MKAFKWVAVAAVSAVVGWLVCFISALVAFRKFQPVVGDLEIAPDWEDDDAEV